MAAVFLSVILHKKYERVVVEKKGIIEKVAGVVLTALGIKIILE